MAFKATSLPAVGMVALFLLVPAVRVVRGAGRPGRRTARLGRLPSRGSAASRGRGPAVAWTAVTHATALPTVDDIPANKTFEVDSIGWSELANSVPAVLSPLQDTNTPAVQPDGSLLLFAMVVNLLLVAAAAGLAWFGRGRDVSTRMAACLLVGMVLGGPAYTALFFLSEGRLLHHPGRYGLSLLPLAAACLAVAATRRRYGGPALVLLGSLGFAAFVAACL